MEWPPVLVDWLYLEGKQTFHILTQEVVFQVGVRHLPLVPIEDSLLLCHRNWEVGVEGQGLDVRISKRWFSDPEGNILVL